MTKALLAIAMLCPVAAGFAAMLDVSSTNDVGAGSLRDLIHSAVPGDTIYFSVMGTIILTNGALVITNDLSIIGPGATDMAISGNGSSRIFQIGSNVSVSISDIFLRDGRAPSGTINSRNGADGGGVYNSGALSLTGCTLSGNVAGGGASGLDCPTIGCFAGGGGAGGNGGAIYNEGALSVNACTFSDNSAGSGGSGGNGYVAGFGGDGGKGGAIYNASQLTSFSSTLSRNSGGAGARGGFGFTLAAGGRGGDGGAIYNTSVLTLTACTISGNSGGLSGSDASGSRSNTGGSGGGVNNTGSANLRSVLIALNRIWSGSSFGCPAGPDLAGAFNSRGHNLIGQIDGGGGLSNGVNADIAGVSTEPLDPKLGPLQNNGGSTFTMALLLGSPAFDHGDDALLNPPLTLTTDQRGLMRRSCVHVDIGAYELQAPVLNSPGKNGNDITITFTTEVGRNYRLEGIDCLGANSWMIVTDNIPGTGRTAEAFDIGGGSRRKRFYRVAMLPGN